MPWLEQVSSAYEWGYSAVVVDLNALDRASDPDPSKTLSDVGLAAGPASLPVEFRADAQAFERDLAGLPYLAELAQRAGVTTLTKSLPPSGSVPASELWPLLCNRLERCASVAADWGLDIALEGVGVQQMRVGKYPFVWKLRDVARFAERCGRNVGLVLDSWHWHAAGESWDALSQAVPMVRVVHLADAPPVPRACLQDGTRLIPGEGVINLHRWLASAIGSGRCVTVVPEIFDDHAARQEAADTRARRVLAATAACLVVRGAQ